MAGVSNNGAVARLFNTDVTPLPPVATGTPATANVTVNGKQYKAVITEQPVKVAKPKMDGGKRRSKRAHRKHTHNKRKGTRRNKRKGTRRNKRN